MKKAVEFYFLAGASARKRRNGKKNEVLRTNELKENKYVLTYYG